MCWRWTADEKHRVKTGGGRGGGAVFMVVTMVLIVCAGGDWYAWHGRAGGGVSQKQRKCAGWYELVHVFSSKSSASYSGKFGVCSQVLLLPLGVPPTQASHIPMRGENESGYATLAPKQHKKSKWRCHPCHVAGCEAWRVLTTLDVGNATQDQGVAHHAVVCSSWKGGGVGMTSG